MHFFNSLSLAALLPFVLAAAPPTLQNCPEGFSTSSIETCTCNGNVCSISLTVVSTPAGFACGNCRWDYSYTINCHECGSPSGNGSVNLGCNPHSRSSQAVLIPCPAGGDWIRVDFTCGYCQ